MPDRDESPATSHDGAPVGITELGIDIIKVERIRASLERFGARFSNRVLTPAEQRYVRDRPETMAGRWAAKEAVSKVLGLGVRGIGWRDIEIERLPTGQPAVRLHGRAAARAEQLGMGRIAGDTAIVVILLGATLQLQSAGGPPLLKTLRGTGSTLTSYVYNNSPAGEGNAPQKAYAAAFVLLVVVIGLNFSIDAISRRRKEGPAWNA